MLQVLPIQTKEEQAAICEKCGVTFKTDCMAYHALVDGELTVKRHRYDGLHGALVKEKLSDLYIRYLHKFAPPLL